MAKKTKAIKGNILPGYKKFGKVNTAVKAVEFAMAADRDMRQKHPRAMRRLDKAADTYFKVMTPVHYQAFKKINQNPKVQEWGSKVANALADRGEASYRKVANVLGNDLNWYNNYPEMTQSGLGINFWLPDTQSMYQPEGQSSDVRVPRVAGVNVMLTFGDSTNTWSQCVSRIWATLRRVNSGTISGNLGDIVKYIHDYRMLLAVWSLYRKLYGLLTHFKTYDPSIPAQFFAACGYDYDTFAANAVDLRMRLNYWREQLSVFAPYNLDIFKRTAWLFDNCYTDSDDEKAQVYTFTMAKKANYYFNYSNSAYPWQNFTVGGGQAITGMLTGITYTMAMSNMEDMVANFCTTANAEIAGNMMKAYGTQNRVDLPFVDENYQTPFVYNEEVLTQIQNANSFDGQYCTIYRPITIDNTTGAVTEIIQLANTGLYAHTGNALSVILNMNHNNVTTLDMVGATRFKFCFTKDTQTTTINLVSWGTEVISDIFIPVVTNNDLVVSNAYQFSNDYHLSDGFATTCYSTYITDYRKMWMFMWLWSNFDWMPMLRMACSYTLNAGQNIQTQLVGGMLDINNRAYFDSTQLGVTHRLATQSMLYVPLLVKEQTNLSAV